MKAPNNDIDALALALALAITAPAGRQYEVIALADTLAAGMSRDAVDTAKGRAETLVASW